MCALQEPNVCFGLLLHDGAEPPGILVSSVVQSAWRPEQDMHVCSVQSHRCNCRSQSVCCYNMKVPSHRAVQTVQCCIACESPLFLHLHDGAEPQGNRLSTELQYMVPRCYKLCKFTMQDPVAYNRNISAASTLGSI